MKEYTKDIEEEFRNQAWWQGSREIIFHWTRVVGYEDEHLK